ARRMVVDSGIAPPARVRVVPHGAPTILLPHLADVTGSDDLAGDGDTHQRTMAHLQGRTVLSTFGLISAGKGIETAIEALAEIAQVHPEVLYLVAGQTHPE